MRARTSVSHFTAVGTRAVWVAVLVLKKQHFCLGRDGGIGWEFDLIKGSNGVEQKQIGTDQHGPTQQQPG